MIQSYFFYTYIKNYSFNYPNINALKNVFITYFSKFKLPAKDKRFNLENQRLNCFLLNWYEKARKFIKDWVAFMSQPY